MNNKKNIVRGLVLVFVIVIISGIWFLKNQDNEPPIVSDNPDFDLVATELDLEHLKSYGLPIMIDFGADECQPCKEMEPVLKEVNALYQGKVIVKFIDVWKDPKLSEGFPVEVIPTQFFFDKDGNPYVPKDPMSMQMQMYSLKETNEHVFTAHRGGMSKEQIEAVFEELGVEK